MSIKTLQDIAIIIPACIFILLLIDTIMLVVWGDSPTMVLKQVVRILTEPEL